MGLLTRDPPGTFCSNARFRFTKTEIFEYGNALMYGMYMSAPENDEKVLFYVFSSALMEISPSSQLLSDADKQLSFIEDLGSLIGARAMWHHGKKTRMQEYQQLLAGLYSLPVLVELEKNERFTVYHLFGFDAIGTKFLRLLAKANFDLYRIRGSAMRGMFGVRGRILRVDASDRTFRTLLGDVIKRDELIGDLSSV